VTERRNGKEIAVFAGIALVVVLLIVVLYLLFDTAPVTPRKGNGHDSRLDPSTLD
jgi:hypothetical protein